MGLKAIKVSHLPVDNPRHTEVLGYPCFGRVGRSLWKKLDWSRWFIDYTEEGHYFSSPRCMYFHVHVTEEDGRDDGRVFRVRCMYAGGKYRGREVESVSIGMQDGALHWIVRCKA